MFDVGVRQRDERSLRGRAPVPAHRYARGSSLLEVMLATLLLAITCIGVLAGQIAMTRETRAATSREQAAWIASSIVESSRGAGVSSGVAQPFGARAALQLPRGMATKEAQGDASVALVAWDAIRTSVRPGEIVDRPESCGGVAMAATRSCVAIAFAP